jgi:hypothetical protein
VSESDTMVLYEFDIDGVKILRHFGVESGDRERLREWLRRFLGDERPAQITVGSPPADISRGLIGPLGEPPDKGVAIVWDAGRQTMDRIGIARATANRWIADLKDERPNIYPAVPADDTVVITDE